MLTDLRSAFLFLTTIPIPYRESEAPGLAFAFFPLVGLFIGVCLWATASVPLTSYDSSAFLVLLVWVIITGGLHLDGFADSCDGLLATVTPDRRLEIMKDSRAGAWAVIGVVLLLLAKWIAIKQVTPSALLLPPVLGRWSMVVAVYYFPYARQTGLGAHFRAGLGSTQIGIATGFMLVTVLLFAFWIDLLALLLLPVAVITVGGAGWWSSHRLGGGLTGDVYGALCEIVELCCLLAIGGIG